MRAASIRQRQTFPSTVTRLFLALAWRSFAATQCPALPSNIEEGVVAVLTADMKEYAK